MASRMNLNSPVQNMSYIWNVSAHVGDNNSCANQADDVKLVKCLLADTIRVCRGGRAFNWIRSSCQVAIDTNTPWDPVSAYYLRIFSQSLRNNHLDLHQSGIVSPATASASYGSHGHQVGYLIALLNLQVFLNERTLFDNYPAQRSIPGLATAHTGP